MGHLIGAAYAGRIDFWSWTLASVTGFTVLLVVGHRTDSVSHRPGRAGIRERTAQDSEHCRRAPQRVPASLSHPVWRLQ